MDLKEYELILKALENFDGTLDEQEIKQKLVKKINLYVESDKLRNNYQENMQKISDELNELLKEQVKND